MNTVAQPEIIGLDVSRDWLDLHCLSDGHQLQLPNTGESHSELAEFAGDREALVCFEATGGHEWRLWASLEAAGIEARQLAPAQVKAFGRSRGTLAKTDRIDAELIACFMAFRPEAGRRRPSASSSSRCANAMRCIARPARRPERPASSKTSTSMSGRCWTGASRTWSSGSRPASTPAEPCPKSPPSCGRFRRSGLWPARCRSRRCPSSAGSPGSRPPRSRGSRRSRGKRMIGGGRRALRCVLHQAALVASIRNTDLKVLANRLRKEGKPHKVVVTAVARKLVVIANALCKSRESWAAKAG